MTPQQAAQLLNSPIFKAYSEGKKIELQVEPNRWVVLHPNQFIIELFENSAINPNNYRIKQEPREFWILVHKDSQIIEGNMHKSQEKAEEYAKDLIDYPECWIPMHVKEILPS